LRGVGVWPAPQGAAAQARQISCQKPELGAPRQQIGKDKPATARGRTNPLPVASGERIGKIQQNEE
jgi:hypothetical protein